MSSKVQVVQGKLEGPGRSPTGLGKVIADAIQKAEASGMELHQIELLRILPGDSGDEEAQVALVFRGPSESEHG